jgi:hypothetical protein
MRLVSRDSVTLLSFLLFPTSSIDRFCKGDSHCEEASWKARFLVGENKTNRIVGRECASCCDAYQSWRYPSLYAETAVSLTKFENPHPPSRHSLKSRRKIPSLRLSICILLAQPLSANEVANSRGFFEIMGFFGDGDWEQLGAKRTHLGGRLCLGVKLDDDFTNCLIWGRATPFSRWSVELPALIFACEWRGPGARLNHVTIPSRICT